LVVVVVVVAVACALTPLVMRLRGRVVEGSGTAVKGSRASVEGELEGSGVVGR